MTRKADFNAEEWSLVIQGPPTAGMMVIAADRGGTVRETVSMARAYAEAREEHGQSELLDDIVSSQPEFDRDRFRSPDRIQEEGAALLREAVQLLRQKATPDEAEAYEGFVRTLADKVAHAHREGGFLGFGGKEVSDNERAALERIADALSSG
jgi:hypothetical protein